MDPITCPKCLSPMRHIDRNGITIERCDSCGGVFLDRSELDQLIKLENQYVDRQLQTAAPPSQERGDSWDRNDTRERDQYRDRDRDRDRYRDRDRGRDNDWDDIFDDDDRRGGFSGVLRNIFDM